MALRTHRLMSAAVWTALLVATPLAAQAIDPGREGVMAEVLAPVPGQSVCFSRSYDPGHLKAHPRQRVAALTLRIRYHRHDPDAQYPAGQRNYYFTASAQLRGDRRPLVASGECGPRGTDIVCGIDCDGGGFALKREAGGAILFDLTAFGRLRMSRGCAEEETAELTPGADDKVFRLTAADPSVCRGLPAD